MSHSAVSIAARARLVIAPTAVAWVAKNRLFQMRLDLERVAADQARRQVVAAAAPRPTSRRCRSCSCSRCRSGRRRCDAHHRRFLRDEGLDGVGALHLGREVDLQDIDARDFGHGLRPSSRRDALRAHCCGKHVRKLRITGDEL